MKTAGAVVGVTRRVLHLTTSSSSGAERRVGTLISQNIVQDRCLQHYTAASNIDINSIDPVINRILEIDIKWNSSRQHRHTEVSSCVLTVQTHRSSQNCVVFVHILDL